MSASTSTAFPDCDIWIQKRNACRTKRGERHEKCCLPDLKAKRCLAWQHCRVEAQAYYGGGGGGESDSAGVNNKNKNLCAAFNEAPCFGNPRVMAIDTARETAERKQIFYYHEKARRKVGNNKQKLNECLELSERLHRCLRKNGVDV